MPTERRNPFEGVTDFLSELSRMRTIGIGEAVGSDAAERTHASAWVPATDILAQGDDLIIRVELAGVEPEDIDLNFAHGALTVSGSRSPGPGDDDSDFYIRERFYGEFRRVINLPDGIDPDAIEAEFDDGLVQITIRGGADTTHTTRITLADRTSPKTRRKIKKAI